jgi:hypothetical protein
LPRYITATRSRCAPRTGRAQRTGR